MSLLSCLLRKKYFTMTPFSIRSIQIFPTSLPIYIKCLSKKVFSVRAYGQIFSLNIYDWFRNWFTFENLIRLSTTLSLEKDRQGQVLFRHPPKWENVDFLFEWRSEYLRADVRSEKSLKQIESIAGCLELIPALVTWNPDIFSCFSMSWMVCERQYEANMISLCSSYPAREIMHSLPWILQMRKQNPQDLWSTCLYWVKLAEFKKKTSFTDVYQLDAAV
jgi:hypothetical protein